MTHHAKALRAWWARHPVTGPLALVLSVLMLGWQPIVLIGIGGNWGGPALASGAPVVAPWNAQSLSALPAADAAGPTFTPPTGCVVPIASMSVTPCIAPTLVYTTRNSPGPVRFELRSAAQGLVAQQQTTPTLIAGEWTARWTVPSGRLAARHTYRVSVIATTAPQRTLVVGRNLSIDLQRNDTQQLWSYAGISAGKVTGEPIASWSSHGLATLAGPAGFNLIHRPTNPGQRGLPQGWALDPSGATSKWKTLTVSDHGLVAELGADDGHVVTFVRTAAGSYLPLLGPHEQFGGGAYATLAAKPSRASPDSNAFTVTDVNQIVTEFPAADLTETRTLAPSEVWTDGSPTLGQTWRAGRLVALTDPVSNRRIHLFYGGDRHCPVPAAGSGFLRAPHGDLCAATDWAGVLTQMSYVDHGSGPQIGRIVQYADTGENAQVTDFAYDHSGRISAFRQPLPAAAIASGVIAGLDQADARAQTTITYDPSGRVQTITSPADLVSGPTQTAAQNTQTTQTLDYARPTSGPDAGRATFSVTQTGSLYPIAESAAILDTMDEVRSTDALGHSTITSHNASDNATQVANLADGTRSLTRYNAQGLPIEAIGPTRRALTATSGAPVVRTTYDTTTEGTGDQAIQKPYEGLVLFGYDGDQFAGPPSVRSVGPQIDGHTASRMFFGYDHNPSGHAGPWSGRMSGVYTAATAGTYRFRANAGVSFWVAGQLCSYYSPCAISLEKDEDARIQVTFSSDASGQVGINLEVAQATGAFAPISARAVSPDLHQVTQQRVADQLKVGGGTVQSTQWSAYDSASGNVLKTSSPQGTSVSYTWAPYTGANGKFGQKTSWTDPAGHTTYQTYYEPTQTASGCDGPAAHQGGLLSSSTQPGPLKSQQVYNAAGNITKATGIGTRTCMTYNNVGQLIAGSITGAGAEYATSQVPFVGNNPLVSSATATSQGASTSAISSISMIGSPVESTDIYGTTTTYAYDPHTGNPTQVTQTTSTGQTRVSTNTYDQYGRLVAVAMGDASPGQTLQTISYLPDGSVEAVNYANGTASQGMFDANNNPSGILYSGFANGSLSETDTHSQAGAILTRELAGPDGTARFGYTYNRDHRLTKWTETGSIAVASRAQTIDFTTHNAVPSNGNRHAQTTTAANGTSTRSTFAYNGAGRLTGSSLPGIDPLAYDPQGRTTSIGQTTLVYDAGGNLTLARGPKGTFASPGTGESIFTPTNKAPITLRASGNLILDADNNIVGQVIGLSGATVALSADGTPISWQYSDMQGSTAWTAAGGQNPEASQTTVYDPWGNRISTNAVATPTTPIELALSGAGWSSGAGVVTLPVGSDVDVIGVRGYSPATGRFIEPDPQVGASMNPYEYANGDPINNADPSGQMSVGGWIGFGVSVLVAAVVTVVAAVVFAPAAPAAGAGLAATIKAGLAAIGASAALSVGVGAVAGGASALAGNVAGQLYDNGGAVDWKTAGIAAAAGAGIGAALGGMSYGIRHAAFTKVLNNGTLKSIVRTWIQGNSTMSELRGMFESDVVRHLATSGQISGRLMPLVATQFGETGSLACVGGSSGQAQLAWISAFVPFNNTLLGSGVGVPVASGAIALASQAVNSGSDGALLLRQAAAGR
ncbi:MAG: RHS repeat-associated core domain-containing protein [Thermoleophilia bacterium]